MMRGSVARNKSSIARLLSFDTAVQWLLYEYVSGAVAPKLARGYHGSSSNYDGTEHHQEPLHEYERPTTPWARQVVSGADLMRHPKFNKGLAFSRYERSRLYLQGLLPPAVLDMETQAERTLLNIRSMETPLQKFLYLQSLHERNERLFYRVVQDNIADLLPVVGTPTVRVACFKYSLMFRSSPRAMFLTVEDKGRIRQVLKNWPERRVRVVVITDGQRVGSMGDLGVNSVSAAISRLALHTAIAGVPPAECLPICVDFGTNNTDLLQSAFYVGSKYRRVSEQQQLELLDELMEALQQRFSHTVVVHFDNMTYSTSKFLLGQYRGQGPVYCDDLQGIAAVALAGILAAQEVTQTPVSRHRYMLVGEGPVAPAIADLLTVAIQAGTRCSLHEAKSLIHLVDSKGLVVRDRGDSNDLPEHMLPYIGDGEACPDLVTAISNIKPTVLIGCSMGVPSPFTFSRAVCEAMASVAQRPIIMPLSLPSADANAENVYAWTDGRCVFGGREGYDESVESVIVDNEVRTPRRAHTAYIYPGLVLGSLVSRGMQIRDEQLLAAAQAVAGMVSPHDARRGLIYPPLSSMVPVAKAVAKAVATTAYEGNFASHLPKPHNLDDAIESNMYLPFYRPYR